MTQKRQPRKQDKQPSPSFGGLIVALTVLTIVGLTIADFLNDGRIDRFLIGALLVLALGFGGFRVDRFLERWR